jgi:hypothetical protein
VLRSFGADERLFFESIRATSVWLRPEDVKRLATHPAVASIDSGTTGEGYSQQAESVGWSYYRHRFDVAYQEGWGAAMLADQ